MCLVQLNLIMQLEHNHHSNNWVLVKSCTTLGTKPTSFWWLIFNWESNTVEMIPVLAFPITPNPWALSIVPPVAHSTETTCKLETLLIQQEVWTNQLDTNDYTNAGTYIKRTCLFFFFICLGFLMDLCIVHLTTFRGEQGVSWTGHFLFFMFLVKKITTNF